VELPDVAAIMRGQHGVISRRQAHAAGITDRQIERRLHSGRWDRVLPGVYVSADAHLTWFAWAHAFVQAAGRSATVVADSAAALRGSTPQRLPITVAIPHQRRSEMRHANLRLVRLDIADSERVQIQGLPTTNRLRTAVDLAHLLPPTQAQPLIDRMLVLDQIDLDAWTAEVTASSRRGSQNARRLAASANDRAAAESERQVKRLLRDAGITGWVSNYSLVLGGREGKLDLALVRLRIGIEVKGWIFHSQADRAASDDDRVVQMQLSSWIVIPVGWLALNTQPQTLVNHVRAAIALREREAAAS
jgi:hypothetical protein